MNKAHLLIYSPVSLCSQAYFIASDHKSTNGHLLATVMSETSEFKITFPADEPMKTHTKTYSTTKEGDSSLNKWHCKHLQQKGTSLCLCTADQNHREDSGCTCLLSPVTSSCSWSRGPCTPDAVSRQTACFLWCKPDCWRPTLPCRLERV